MSESIVARNYIIGPGNIWVPQIGTAEGNPIVQEKAVVDTPETFKNTNFITGGSPAILDVNAALGRNGTQFSIMNDGPGDFTVAISNAGAAFGDEHTMKDGEVYAIDNISVDQIRITWIANSAYRAVAL